VFLVVLCGHFEVIVCLFVCLFLASRQMELGFGAMALGKM
jgi:hypothetical protein